MSDPDSVKLLWLVPCFPPGTLVVTLSEASLLLPTTSIIPGISGVVFGISWKRLSIEQVFPGVDIKVGANAVNRVQTTRDGVVF